MDDLQYTENELKSKELENTVLNLIINGWPSILNQIAGGKVPEESFKPYYKWMTFNTKKRRVKEMKNLF